MQMIYYCFIKCWLTNDKVINKMSKLNFIIHQNEEIQSSTDVWQGYIVGLLQIKRRARVS